MRFAQYTVPGDAGPAECVVYYFGPGQGGDPTANAVRWARQFKQPDGSSSLDKMKVTPLEGTAVTCAQIQPILVVWLFNQVILNTSPNFALFIKHVK